MTHTPTSHATRAVEAGSGIEPERGKGFALLVLCVVQAMLVLDVTVVNVALPVMSAELGFDPALAGWAIAAYAIPFGGLLILGGRLADALGTRRMLFAGLALFTAASLAAGFAADATWLLAARAAQGVGAALLSPAALATLLQRFTGPSRHRALAAWGAVGGGGAAIGVLLGGLLTGGPGWRWIFFINIPVGILVAIALPTIVGATVVHARGRGRIDVVGAILATTGIASLVASITAARLMPPLIAAGIAVLGVALLAAFVAVERRAARPLLRIALLRSRPVASGSLLMLLATGVLVGSFFMFSFELQAGAGWSPIATGLAFLPISLGVIGGAHVAGRAVGHAGARRVAPVALLTSALGLGATAATVSLGLGEVLAIAGMTVAALGLGAGFVCASTTALSQVETAEAGSASGVLNSFHEIGSAVGVAGFAAIAASSIGLGFTVAAVIAAATAVLAASVIPAGATGGGRTFMH
jgi:EmrB/QacA subfamily drug resistance transporter